MFGTHCSVCDGRGLGNNALFVVGEVMDTMQLNESGGHTLGRSVEVLSAGAACKA